GLVSRGADLSRRPYESFGGDRVAGLSDNEQSAIDIAAQRSPAARDAMTKAGVELDEASALEFGEDLDQYMNPYVDAVLQPQLREQNRAYERGRTSLVNSKGGAWGGDRSAFETS